MGLTYSRQSVSPMKDIPKCFVCKHVLSNNFLRCNVCNSTLHYECIVLDSDGHKTICSYCNRKDTLVPVLKK